jgi:hypothetical protein
MMCCAMEKDHLRGQSRPRSMSCLLARGLAEYRLKYMLVDDVLVSRFMTTRARKRSRDWETRKTQREHE